MSEREVLARRKENLRLRARIIEVVRQYFNGRNYLEVETPLRIPAPAPESHIDAIPSRDWFLHTSPELCMKRLMAAGYHQIFQISKCFRDGERGSNHLPEFTMLEWYRAGIDYCELMNECEALVLFIAQSLEMGDRITYQGRTIDLRRPWQRLTIDEAFTRFSPVSINEALESGCFDEVMVMHVEPGIFGEKPAFLYDYPLSLASLARKKKEDPTVAERFEMYIGGLELANAFSELTDAEEQRLRFSEERECRRGSGKTVYPSPEKFLNELGYMPDAAGIALGVDRLVMLFTDRPVIDDVVAFTQEDL